MNGSRQDDRARADRRGFERIRFDRRLRIARSRIDNTVTGCHRKWLRVLVALRLTDGPAVGSIARPGTPRSRNGRPERIAALRNRAGSKPPARAKLPILSGGRDRLRMHRSLRGGRALFGRRWRGFSETLFAFGNAFWLSENETAGRCAAHRRGGLTGPRARLGQRSGQLTMRSSSASDVTSSSRSLTRPRTETPA